MSKEPIQSEYDEEDRSEKYSQKNGCAEKLDRRSNLRNYSVNALRDRTKVQNSAKEVNKICLKSIIIKSEWNSTSF